MSEQGPALQFATYRFLLRAVDPIQLPPNAGSTLRGGFGNSFRRIACFQRNRPPDSCADCLVAHTCPHGYIFETRLPPDSEVLRAQREIPHPFVLEPPVDPPPVYQPGASLEFRAVLVGRAIAYLPYFALAFRHLGGFGVGRGRGRYDLEEVRAEHPLDGRSQAIYRGVSEGLGGARGDSGGVRGARGDSGVAEASQQGTAPPSGSPRDPLRPSEPPRVPLRPPDAGTLLSCTEDLTATYADLAARCRGASPSRVTVRFQTPTRLVSEERLVVRPEFAVLVRAALRRISSLAYFHCGRRWETDYRGLVAAAEGVRLAECGVRWVDWERYSSRQEARMKLGGLVGAATYEGPVAPFLPLLLAVSVVHVGKACTFGNGRVGVEW